MIIVEKNEGVKINYSVDGTKLTLNDEMTLDLGKYERDFPVHIDICTNKFGFLSFGLSEKYVAQIDIPAREYQEVQNGTDEEGNPKIEMVPVAFDMDKVKLTLWSLEG
ncbi:hypothetical protein [Caloranaerobacter azorensis]|uniref:Uncharacterized protein n=1 Tax=Caloranaerobacter azorensis TaxID=116090 RepID=A0A6P1YAL7_9FIRM|nr:hypothetical protein [Caloranaerobacter azorensis]QIB26114.1 hypothetical protein G3A45_01585 [Caloranaerobacter azorensis]